MISIIVPAFNEAEVIARGLTALTCGAGEGELEVIVVCNGCTDQTAAVARQFGPPVTVLETPLPSKANALNLGDAVAHGFPRFYVDADVVLSLASVRRMVEFLQEPQALVAAPTIRLDLCGCTWAVKAFYEIDRLMPSHKEGLGGSGVYALNEAGRRRFSEFPMITSDDGFVRLCFAPCERISVDGAYSTVSPPRDLSGLIKIKTRSHFGNSELATAYPRMLGNSGPGNRLAVLSLRRQPRLWPQLAVYLYVKAAARMFAYLRIKGSAPGRWERDNSSRRPVSTPPAEVQL